MSDPRVIKKYPNRRLYDTAVSSYITLEDVRKLVLEDEPFVVQDAKTKADITRSILLQIIMEREEGGQPLFSEQVLSEFIRFYGGSMQGVITDYLEKSMSMLVQQHADMQQQVQSMMTKDPLTAMRDAAEQNMNLWREMQEGFMRASGLPGFGSPARREGEGKSRKDSGSDDT